MSGNVSKKIIYSLLFRMIQNIHQCVYRPATKCVFVKQVSTEV